MIPVCLLKVPAGLVGGDGKGLGIESMAMRESNTEGILKISWNLRGKERYLERFLVTFCVASCAKPLRRPC